MPITRVGSTFNPVSSSTSRTTVSAMLAPISIAPPGIGQSWLSLRRCSRIPRSRRPPPRTPPAPANSPGANRARPHDRCGSSRLSPLRPGPHVPTMPPPVRAPQPQRAEFEVHPGHIGQVGLPLASRGITVEGIEASEAMVARLRAKPGGEQIPVSIGDMADVPATGPFRLVYLVYNTIFNLISPERQTDCFRNVTRVLEPDGAFVIECFVPDPSKFDRGQRVEALSVTEDSATIEVSRHDAAAQRYNKQTIRFSHEGIRLLPVALRYSWPSELDLMARLAGLRLRERYADWDRRPFGSTSTSHISVYRPA